MLALVLLCTPGRSAAAPDLLGAGEALLATPFQVTGTLLGGVSLIGAALIGTAGDTVSLLDRNRVTEPVLGGIASGSIHTIAWGLQWGGTRSMELLRREDIERLPEPLAAYWDTARYAGRFDSAASGFRALGLAVNDLVAGPSLAVLRASGARGTSERLASWRRDTRIVALGPDPLPTD